MTGIMAFLLALSCANSIDFNSLSLPDLYIPTVSIDKVPSKSDITLLASLAALGVSGYKASQLGKKVIKNSKSKECRSDEEFSNDFEDAFVYGGLTIGSFLAVSSVTAYKLYHW